MSDIAERVTVRNAARATAASGYATLPSMGVQLAREQTDFETVAQHMFALMMRNVSSDGYRFTDPVDQGQFSKPGCVIAAPSYPANQPGVDQDYVFNWTRDAALTAMEIAAAGLPSKPGAGVPPLVDYTTFAKVGQDNAQPTLAHACYTIEGQSRSWTEQSDGPALQSLALLQAFPQLDNATQALATQVVGTNVGWLLQHYQEQTTNLWEEHLGYSFFARAAQLKFFRALSANPYKIDVPAGTSEAIAWLESALQDHWDGNRYLSVISQPPGGGAPSDPGGPGYDPNIDIVMAVIYGAVSCTDTQLLATAAQLRAQWDVGGDTAYVINQQDRALGIGPLFGRYPGDTYDGDINDHVLGGHPWALCTANFAELYYRVGTEIASTRTLPLDDLSRPFFAQVGVGNGTSPEDAIVALDRAADAMLQAVVYHSDNLELSEQYDGWTGYEKSVRNLTWSYGAFLSAVRAKSGRNVQG